MSALVRCQVILESDTALPSDRFINTYHFVVLGVGVPVTVASANIDPTVVTLYQALDQHMSLELSGIWSRRYYNLADPLPRVPFLIQSGPNLVPATGGAPAEVALVVSFQGTMISGLDQRRRRGRVFLGPLGSNMIDAAVSPVRPVTSAITTYTAAYDAFLTSSKASADYKWVVHSPTAGPGISVDVDNGWIDNSFDTQRRRGARATSRNLFS